MVHADDAVLRGGQSHQAFPKKLGRGNRSAPTEKRKIQDQNPGIHKKKHKKNPSKGHPKQKTEINQPILSTQTQPNKPEKTLIKNEKTTQTLQKHTKYIVIIIISIVNYYYYY